MVLRRTLFEHDGKSTAMLERAAERYRDEPSAVDDTIFLLDSPEGHTATAASWVLKYWLADGRQLSPDQVAAIGACLPSIGTHWAALHISQSMRFLEVPSTCAAGFQAFLDDCSRSERPFLRAWGTDGLVRFAARYPEAEAVAEQRLAAALADPAPSVRARARRLLEEGAGPR